LTLPANIIEQLTLLKLHDKRKKKQTKSSYSVFNLCISIECRTSRTTAKNYTNGASKTCYKRQQNRALYSHQNKTSKLIQTIPLIHVFTQDRKDNDLLHMLSISKHADLHFGAGYLWQLNRATEPLVLLGVKPICSSIVCTNLRGLSFTPFLIVVTASRIVSPASLLQQTKHKTFES
jgi:hypothetical protein